MTKETKHTPLPWNIFIVNHNGWSIDDRDTKPFLPLYRIGDADTEVTAQEAIATGQYMERACNSHEALVEALKAIVAALSQPVQARIERTEDRAVRALEIVHGDCQFAVRTAQEALALASSHEQK